MARQAAASDGKGGLTRNRAVVARNTALLIIDVQNFSILPGRGEWAGLDPQNIPQEMGYYFERIEKTILPNIARLQAAFRSAGAEVIYTVIESLSRDGRERGLDYKITGFLVPKDSFGARMPREVEPLENEIIIPKSSSSVFNSTNIEYILGNLEIDYLVVAGLVTDQCVESAVRDACDRNFLVSLIPDACGTLSEDRQLASLRALKGYCRQLNTEEMVAEIKGGS